MGVNEGRPCPLKAQRVLGLPEIVTKRWKPLLVLGISEQEMVLYQRQRRIQARPPSLSRRNKTTDSGVASKAVRVLGCSQAQLCRSKAQRVLGVTASEMEQWLMQHGLI